MNRNIVARSLFAIGITAYLYAIIRIARDSIRLHAEHKLDRKAIEATEREMLDRVADGQFRGMSLTDIQREFYETLDFNKIAVREDV